jgi:hypothetical protein
MSAIELPAEAEVTPVEMPSTETAPAARPEEPSPPAVILPMVGMPSAPVRPQPAYRQQVARTRRQKDFQLSLF